MGAARRSLPRRRFEAGVTVRLAPQPCPKCAPTIDAASVPLKFDELIAPVPGDLTVCVSCSAILVYAAGPGHPWRLLDLRDWMTLDAGTRRKLIMMGETLKKFRGLMGCNQNCHHTPPFLPCNALPRSEEHTSELQSRLHLVCRLLLEKKKTATYDSMPTQTHRSQLSKAF